jgi:hypothetical protein
MPVVISFNKTHQVLRAFEDSARKATKEACFDTEAEAKMRIRANRSIDTGAAWASIYTSVDGETDYDKAISEAKSLNPEAKFLPPIRTKKHPDMSEGIVSVGVEYGADLELGTEPHVIVPRDKKALFWPGAAHPVKKVNHPGTPAKPYLIPDAEKVGAQYDKVCLAIMKAEIK